MDRLQLLAPAPKDSGRVAMLIARGEEGAGERLAFDSVMMSPELGVAGDRWSRDQRAGEKLYGQRYQEMQIAAMEAPVAQLIANGQPLTLFGDNLLLELDLSGENVPTGSQLRMGSATLEVTPFPHNGCDKFRDRFGSDALRFVSQKSLRLQNLRGIYLRVMNEGLLTVGDKVEVISRP